MNVLYKDSQIIAVDKPFGVPTAENGLISLVRKMLSELGESEELFPVHRLDTKTTGAIVFARTQKAAGIISNQIVNGEFEKEYLAVVFGNCPETGEFEDELFFDRTKNKSFVRKNKRSGTKHACLTFTRLDKKDDLSLVLIKLQTGRTHQIRVQFSSRKLPLYGDGKYGSKINGDLALHCKKISFLHPVTKEKTVITCECENKKPWNLFFGNN